MAIPSEMLYIKGMAMTHRYAGTASAASSKSTFTMADNIRNPTKIRAGAVANPGTAVKIGAKKMATRNRSPVTIEASPVLAPAPTPPEVQV